MCPPVTQLERARSWREERDGERRSIRRSETCTRGTHDEPSFLLSAGTFYVPVFVCMCSRCVCVRGEAEGIVCSPCGAVA